MTQFDDLSDADKRKAMDLLVRENAHQRRVVDAKRQREEAQRQREIENAAKIAAAKQQYLTICQQLAGKTIREVTIDNWRDHFGRPERQPGSITVQFTDGSNVEIYHDDIGDRDDACACLDLDYTAPTLVEAVAKLDQAIARLPDPPNPAA